MTGISNIMKKKYSDRIILRILTTLNRKIDEKKLSKEQIIEE